MHRTVWLTTIPTILCLLAFLEVPRQTAPQTLRQAADRADILIGAAIRPSLFPEEAYSETLAREFNLVEPEDAMKWAVIRRSPDEFNFHDGDTIVDFAQAHGMKLRGHCLVWDHDNPDWLAKHHFTQDQLSHLLQTHIETVTKHYTNRVFAWDVVNEAFDENGNLKDSLWYNQPGIRLSNVSTAYIEQSFRWAHRADPAALLFYNDNGGEGLTRKSDAIYGMLKDFKHRGVPIDGVRLQMHISNLDFDAGGVGQNIARLAALGLQVHITELDISLTLDSFGRPNKNDVERQAQIYREIARVCLQNPRCTAIQIWGFTDKYSWISSHTHHTGGAALLFDVNYRPKPAYEAVLEELSAGRP